MKSSRISTRALRQVLTPESMELDSLEVENCVRCDGDSGSRKLLVCSEMGCPIAIHEECMCSEPVFDELGKFYCPYCAYKREFVRTRALRRKAMSSKRVLSMFIDVGKGNGCGCGDGRGGGRVGGGEGEEEDNERRREIGNVGGGERRDEEEDIVVEETQEGDTEPRNACCGQERMDKDNGRGGLDLGGDDGIRVDEENEGRSEEEGEMQSEEKEVTANGAVVSESDELDTGSPLVRKKRFKQKAKKSRESSSRQTSASEKTANKQNEKAKTKSKRERELHEFARNLVLPNGNRKRLNWTDEELEMLKEGVRIYTKPTGKIPWKKILEFGRNVFHITREPVDLKDKWRRHIIGKR